MAGDSAGPHSAPQPAPPALARDGAGQGQLVRMTEPASGRVVETESLLPAHAFLMLVLTVAYLVLAASFSARLLDAIPGRLDDAQLDGVAAWSTLLLGFGLALAVWGAVVLPMLARGRLAWGGRVGVLVLIGSLAALGGGVAHQVLLAGLLDDPRGENGRRATHLLVTALGGTEMGGVVARPSGSASGGSGGGSGGEVEAVASQRAFLAANMLIQARHAANGEAQEARAVAVLDALTARRIGTAAQVYDNVFVPSVRSLRDAFNSYVAAQMALAEDIRSIPERQAAETRGGAEEAPPLGASPSMRLREMADALYEQRVSRLFGAVLPPGLEWEAFTAHPIVQARWRAALDVPDGIALAATMGFPAFQETIYQPMHDRAVAPRREMLLAPPESFAPEGVMRRDGQAALRWIAIPALALIVALVGIFWHAGALAFQLATMMAPGWRGRRVVVVVGLLAGLVCLAGARPEITRAEAFQQFEEAVHAAVGPGWLAARAAIVAESTMHEWGTATRRLLLGGYDFGLAPQARKTGDAQAALERLTP